jgi:hypothetical protein
MPPPGSISLVSGEELEMAEMKSPYSKDAAKRMQMSSLAQAKRSLTEESSGEFR